MDYTQGMVFCILIRFWPSVASMGKAHAWDRIGAKGGEQSSARLCARISWEWQQ